MGEGTSVWMVGMWSLRSSCVGRFTLSLTEGLQVRVVGSSSVDEGAEGEDVDADASIEFSAGTAVVDGGKEQPQTALWKEVSPESRKLVWLLSERVGVRATHRGDALPSRLRFLCSAALPVGVVRAGVEKPK